MSKQELTEKIHSIISELYDKNIDEYGNKFIVSNFDVQLAVHATLKILEELGVVELPKE